MEIVTLKRSLLFCCVGFAFVCWCVSCDAPPDDAGEAKRLYPGACTMEVDIGNDGVVDELTIYDYNDEGQLVRKEFLEQGAPNPDLANSYDTLTLHQYNDQGLLARTEHFPNGYGESETVEFDREITSNTYNANQQLIRVASFHRRGSVISLESVTETQYDPDGRKQIQMVYDLSAEGGFSHRIVYDYQVAQVEFVIWDQGEGTLPYKTKRRVLDSQGRTIRNEWDDNADGILEILHLYSYDNQGRVAAFEYEFNLSDNPESGFIQYTYDASGLQTISEFDYMRDGDVDILTVETWDEFGLQKIVEIDGHRGWGVYPQDGILDERYVYTYDQFGNLLTIQQNGNGQGEFSLELFSKLTTFTYDCWGK